MGDRGRHRPLARGLRRRADGRGWEPLRVEVHPPEFPVGPTPPRRSARSPTRSSEAEEIAELIGLARSSALSGWDAPSAQGYEAFCAEALSCAHGLIEVGAAAAGPLRAYATELEAAQRAFAGAVEDERSAERGLDSAERGSREEHRAEADLDEARGAKASAFEAALEANQRAAHQIEAIADGVPAAPAAPVPPAAPAQDGPREDTGVLDYLANDLGGDLKGAFDTDLGFGDPDSQTYQEGQAFYSRPVPKLAVNLLGPTKFKLAGQGVFRGGQAVVAGARAIPGVADDAAKAAAGAAAATAAALGGIVFAHRPKKQGTGKKRRGRHQAATARNMREQKKAAEQGQKGAKGGSRKRRPSG